MKKTDTKEIYIDCHCHILPRLDDGPQDLEQTYKLLEYAWREGIRTMVATTHYRPQLWHTTPEQYSKAFEQASQIAKEIDPMFQLIPGNELFCTDGFMYGLRSGECLVLPGRHVLVEFPYHSELSSMLSALEILRSYDYYPILAHAERYDCLVQNKRQIPKLREQGVLIQINTGSITGENGFGIRRFTRGLLKAEQIDLLGSDCHDTDRRPPRYRDCAQFVRRHCSRAYAQALLQDNPQRLIEAL